MLIPFSLLCLKYPDSNLLNKLLNNTSLILFMPFHNKKLLVSIIVLNAKVSILIKAGTMILSTDDDLDVKTVGNSTWHPKSGKFI